MKRHAPILIVEDSEDDTLLIRRTLSKSGLPNPRHFVKTGEQAISYLDGTGRYSDRKKYPFPGLVLLDLKLPVIDGFDVLGWIRSNPDCINVRVVVLTSSQEIRCVSKAYGMGANSFLVKPLEFENIRAFFATVRGQLWNNEPAAVPTLKPPRTPIPERSQTRGRIRGSTDVTTDRVPGGEHKLG